MKRKYYMRGLGIGVIVTAIVCAIAFPKSKPTMTDEEIIARAQELGYVKDEESVTADDIDKIKENEQVTPSPETSTTPEVTPEPTPEAPTPPDEPEVPTQPTPVTEQGKVTDSPESTKAVTKTPTKIPTKTPTPEPTKVPSSGEKVSYTVRVERGMTATKVAELLETAGAIEDSAAFVGYLRDADLTDYINIGTFTIPVGASYQQIADILTK